MKLPKIKLTMKQKVKFGRIRAVAWIVIGIASFFFGLESSVILVWVASFYANAESGFATGEAADDSLVLKELRELRQLVEQLMAQQNGRHSEE